MNDSPQYKTDTEKHEFWTRTAIRIAVCILIIGGGLAGAAYLKKSGPKPKKKPPEAIVALVKTQALERADEKVIINAMGSVIPAREMVLKSQVSGEIINIHPEFTEGGFLKAGDELLRIDPVDYELALTQKESDVADAQYALKMELGHQEVAKREWRLLAGRRKLKDEDAELALRKPHLAKAEADLKSSQADLKQAEINLSRTVVRAPFNALVRSKNVNIGSLTAAQGNLAELVGVDEYWIQASIPVDRLRWLHIPRNQGEKGAAARIRYNSGLYERNGEVVKLLGDLDTGGRMARILISVKDPMNLNAPDAALPPLLIGEYVQVEIEGRAVSSVFRIPRSALRDNDSVWIATPENTLTVRPVKTVWRDAETVFIQDGIQDGEQLVISDLAGPVEGMALQITSDAPVPAEKKKAGDKGKSHEQS